MGDRIEIRRPDGQSVPGYLAKATATHSAPGIVLFEEWWGLDERIEAAANRLASSGFDVVVPDLFRGRKAAAGDEANHLMQGLDFEDATVQDGGGAAQFLRDHGSPRVGVMGFCMGGALAMLSLMRGIRFDAASIWYGYPPTEAGDPATIEVPVQAHWALKDDFFSIEGADAIEHKLRAAGKPYEFHRYDAEHGFYNPAKPGEGGLGHYHAEHAETAWRRSVEFFNRTLR